MIAVILLTIFGGLFAAMAFAPLAIEEGERVGQERRRDAHAAPAPASLAARRGAVADRERVAA